MEEGRREGKRIIIISSLLLLLFVVISSPLVEGELITYASLKGQPYTVTYDHRSFFINGSRVLLLSGSVHYPRSTPAMWPQIFDLALQNGLNTIETYVFWNYHEAVRGIYDFTGRGDLVQFIEQAAAHNLFVNLRIGPYVCAEWDYGGFPLWLRDIDGIQFRTYNGPFMNEMQNFVQYILTLVKPYLAPQGGNIILAQIENEYGGGANFTKLDQAYVDWCGNLVAEWNVGVPWIMCNGHYANNTIETCNSCYCDTWIADHWKNQPNTPPGWTENEGWFDQWGKARLMRNTTEVAYSVARYIAFGGALHNYYMWHGGNNYGRTGAASVTTSYANDVLVDSMALPHEPKYSFMRALHVLLAQYSPVLLGMNPPAAQAMGTFADLLDYGAIKFLSNYADNQTATISLWGNTYFLPLHTVLIFDANKNLLFNTSNVSNEDIPHKVSVQGTNFAWAWYTEPVGPTISKLIVKNPTPLEHLVVSQDMTDYAWYSVNVNITAPGDLRIVSIMSHAYSVYFDGQFVNVNWDVTKSCCDRINVTVGLSNYNGTGMHRLDILSTSLGIENGGLNMELFAKGIVGDVILGGVNITQPQDGQWWEMQRGLVGEDLEIYVAENYDLVPWAFSSPPKNTPITWYSTTFNTPVGPGTVAVDLTGAGKGIAYVNGNSIGRYWTIPGNCSGDTYGCFGFAATTAAECTEPTQVIYHIPPDWLSPKGVNSLVLFEELGAPNIDEVSVVVVY